MTYFHIRLYTIIGAESFHCPVRDGKEWLRCFQRLSLPDIATRRCHWRDNRYTRDRSTPVLSVQVENGKVLLSLTPNEGCPNS